MRSLWIRTPEAPIVETGGCGESVESELRERAKRVHGERREARRAGDNAAEERALRELIDIEQASLRGAPDLSPGD
jgi:hypothetical protein